MFIFDSNDVPAKKFAKCFQSKHRICRIPPDPKKKPTVSAPVPTAKAFEEMSAMEREAFIAFQKDFRKGR